MEHHRTQERGDFQGKARGALCPTSKEGRGKPQNHASDRQKRFDHRVQDHPLNAQTENKPGVGLPVNCVMVGVDLCFPTGQAPPQFFLSTTYTELIHGAALLLDLDGEKMLIERRASKINVLGWIR